LSQKKLYPNPIVVDTIISGKALIMNLLTQFFNLKIIDEIV